MIWVNAIRILFLTLSIASALLINFILFESIRKTSELMIFGVNTSAELVDEKSFRLKFSIQEKIYLFEGKATAGANEALGSQIPIIYNKNKPESAATTNQFKMLKSFLILLILLFVVLLFSIYAMLRKIYLSMLSSPDTE
jgi:hypothetical protein